MSMSIRKVLSEDLQFKAYLTACELIVLKEEMLQNCEHIFNQVEHELSTFSVFSSQFCDCMSLGIFVSLTSGLCDRSCDLFTFLTCM